MLTSGQPGGSAYDSSSESLSTFSDSFGSSTFTAGMTDDNAEIYVEEVVSEAAVKNADSLIPPALLKLTKVLVEKLPGLQCGKLKGTEAEKTFFSKNFGQRQLYYEIEYADYSKAPDLDSAAYPGTKIYLVRWELGFPHFQARCRYLITYLTHSSNLKGHNYSEISSCNPAGVAMCSKASGGSATQPVGWQDPSSSTVVCAR